MSEPPHRLTLLPKPSFCYLQIPAIDVHESAHSTKQIFGWNIRHRESEHPSFDDAAGNISGAWFTDLKIAREPGLLPSIWVDGIDEVLAKIAAARRRNRRTCASRLAGQHVLDCHVSRPCREMCFGYIRKRRADALMRIRHQGQWNA